MTSNGMTEVRIPRWGRKGLYRFQGGFLARASDPVETQELLSSFWFHPPRDDGRRFWEVEGKRWKLWFENPNEAGALLALLALLAFGGFLSLRGFTRIHCLFGTAFAVIGLVQTGSRGGMMGLLIGGGMMVLARAVGKFTIRRMFRLGLVLFALAGVVYLLFGQTRIIGRLLALDEGNLIRLNVWSAVPRMMACAPFGWWMPSGYCYCDWFQPLSFNKPLRYLLSTHLSVMAYGGYAVAFAYVFAWIAILHSLLAAAVREGRLLALGLWAGLGTAMFFSPIGVYHWEPWVLPTAALAVHVFRRLRKRDFGVARFGWDALASAALIVVLAAIGLANESSADDPLRIRRVSGGVQIGRGKAEVCVLDDGFVLSGGCIGEFGKGLRAYAMKHPLPRTVKLADSWDGVPDAVECLVLTGSRCTEYLDRQQRGLPGPSAETVYFISPQEVWPACLAAMRSDVPIRMVLGSLVFEAVGGKMSGLPFCTVVPGAALYIPDWPGYVGL